MTALLPRLRRSAPAPMRAAGQKMVRSVGRLTPAVRLLPTFLVVGAQRAGTTTLHRLLSGHPAISPPLFHKGTNFFDLWYDRGWSWYRGHFPVRSLARARTHSAEPVTFESSGYYMFHPLAAGRIARDLPETRLVALVRDPVERAYSAYRHEFARGFETEADFGRALELEDERLLGEEHRIREDPAYQSFGHRHHAYARRSLYTPQLRRLRDAVSPDRLFTLDADAFFAEPEKQFVRLQEWLGLPVWIPEVFPKLNARPGRPLPTDLRQRLMNGFEAADQELVEFLGDVPSWRR
ncbi:hypothetical protein GCM10009765_41850 [Fodinicola feengrottensis]|uniref:Sulfotransferase n=1 Tax=Fodinicola feengrottensis TaxID=435914 RepID=A0ABP4TIP7_9ACTN